MDRGEAEQLEAAKRLWEYSATVGLSSFLSELPSRQSEWRFEDEEAFVFEISEVHPATDFDSWVRLLGIVPFQVSMVGVVNHDDWSMLLRDEAIRLSKPLKVIGPPPSKESLLCFSCVAEWNRVGWVVRFEDPDWLVRNIEGTFSAVRPGWNEIEPKILAAIESVKQMGTKGSSPPPPTLFRDSAWAGSVVELEPFHRKILAESSSCPWFHRVWSCVWPVIYREQNRLRGPCDLDALRRELEVCFRCVPQLTVWGFVMGKLLCHHRLRRGLGICGEFQ